MGYEWTKWAEQCEPRRQGGTPAEPCEFTELASLWLIHWGIMHKLGFLEQCVLNKMSAERNSIISFSYTRMNTHTHTHAHAHITIAQLTARWACYGSLSLSLSPSQAFSLSLSYTQIYTHIRTHKRLNFSPSLSLSHTHTHTHIIVDQVRNGRVRGLCLFHTHLHTPWHVRVHT